MIPLEYNLFYIDGFESDVNMYYSIYKLRAFSETI